METLERVETRHKEILKTFDQVENILAPIHTNGGKYDMLNFNAFNIERLAKNSDLLSSEFCGVNITTEAQRLPAWHPRHSDKPNFNKGAPSYNSDEVLISIEGENFGYTFAPQQICNIKKGIEKSFKAVGSFTKKESKVIHPAKVQKPSEPTKGLIKNDSMLIKDSKKVQNDNKKVYICKVQNSEKQSERHEKIQVNENPDELKTVNFQIEGKYIDQIYKGEKVEDYRAINPVNAKKLCEHIDKKDLKPGEQFVIHFKEIWRLKKDLTHVRFFNGYKTDRKELLIEIKGLELNKYTKVIPEGMKPGTICFTLILGQIVVSKNFKDENQ